MPSARYLLKLADAQDHVTAYIVRQLQEQGLHCIVDKSHIIVSADDEKLKLQARITISIQLEDVCCSQLTSLTLSALSLA